MDSHIRCIGVDGHKEWIIKAATIQQQYCMTKNSWKWCEGNSDVLVEEMKALFDSHCHEIAKNVEKLVDVIYKQVYGFSEFKIKFLEPQKKCINASKSFIVIHGMNSFFIDEAGDVYSSPLDFFRFQKKVSFIYHPYRVLKVGDVNGLTEEVGRSLHGETYKVDKLVVMILRKLGLCSDFATSSLFIIGKRNEDCVHFPAVRICSKNQGPCKQSTFYVDHVGRVYKDWDDFLSNNVYPECIMCYPRNGTYQAKQSGKVLLDVAWSPAKGNVKNIFYNIGAAIGVGSLLLGSSALAPAGIAIASVAGLCQGSSQLLDRFKHGQSLTDLEAAGGWLNMFGGVAGIGRGSLMLAQGLKTGKKVTKGIEIAAKVSNGIYPRLSTAGKMFNTVLAVDAIGKEFRGVIITPKDVDVVFSYVMDKSIQFKNFVIDLNYKVKHFFVKLWYTYFPFRDHHVAAKGISDTISMSKNLESNLGDFKDENDVYCFANLTVECIAWK